MLRKLKQYENRKTCSILKQRRIALFSSL